MATSAETRVVNAAGDVQGVALVAAAMCAWSFVVAAPRASRATVALPGSGAR
jgi:hypothetical protein